MSAISTLALWMVDFSAIENGSSVSGQGRWGGTWARWEGSWQGSALCHTVAPGRRGGIIRTFAGAPALLSARM
jgi:hypothetical protein